MLVQFGNTAPLDNGVLMDTGGAPCVTYINLHDYAFDAAAVADVIKTHLYDAVTGNQGITALPGQEALLAVVHPDGIWAAHSAANPSWVDSDNPAFAALMSAFYGCPVGTPNGVEDTHFTLAGPPGFHPGDDLNLTAQITQNGRDIVARALGGGASLGLSGVSTTAPGATTYTLDGKTTTLNQYAGQRIIAAPNGSPAASGAVWANIISNTAATPGVLTLDRWYNPATPGGTAASTPAAGPYAIIDGSAPAWFVGISAGSNAPGSAPNTGTSLSSASGTAEITTASGGLVRQIAPFAHTASAQTWTLTPVFTANGSDSLPVTVQSYGVFNSMVVADTTGTMLYYNTFGSATLSASGDNLTLTITVTTT